MASIAVLISPSLGRAVVAEEHQPGMISDNCLALLFYPIHVLHLPFRCICQQVKGGIIVEKEITGVTGLRANDIGTLDGVAAKEDWLYMIISIFINQEVSILI